MADVVNAIIQMGDHRFEIWGVACQVCRVAHRETQWCPTDTDHEVRGLYALTHVDTPEEWEARRRQQRAEERRAARPLAT